MIINIEELNKRIVLATQDAWRRETNTTINSIVEFIVKEAVLALTEQLNTAFADIQKDIDQLYVLNTELSDDLYPITHQDTPNYKEKPLEGIKVHGSKNGGIQKPQRNPQGRPKGEPRVTAG